MRIKNIMKIISVIFVSFFTIIYISQVHAKKSKLKGEIPPNCKVDLKCCATQCNLAIYNPQSAGVYAACMKLCTSGRLMDPSVKEHIVCLSCDR